VAYRELVGEHLTHQMLLAPAGRVDQLIECRGLLARQPDKQWNTIIGHSRNDSRLLSNDIKRGLPAWGTRVESPLVSSRLVARECRRKDEFKELWM
jgi:hypothetical protein